MDRKKLAFGLGAGGITVLVLTYLLLVAVMLFGTAYKGGLEGFVEGTLFTFLPALFALVALLVSRTDPFWGGFGELILGGLGVIIGIVMLVSNLDSLFKIGWYNDALIFGVLASSALMLASGLGFEFAARKKETLPG